MQKHHQIQANRSNVDPQFFDRSPLCTYALCQFLGYSPTQKLIAEINRMHEQAIYQKIVFFIENLGFIKNTSARQINFEDSLRFERIHDAVYTNFGYTCIKIPAASTEKRLAMILAHLQSR